MNQEFFFADRKRIHRISVSYSPQISQLLKAAHPKLTFGSFLGWRPWLDCDGVR
jgi:hypothetical protein